MPHNYVYNLSGGRLLLSKVRTVHYGLDATGIEAVRLAAERRDFEVLAAIDSHPARAGRDLGSVAGPGNFQGITVAYDPETALRQSAADVVLHTSNGGSTSAFPELLLALSAGKNVISNTPGLVYPWLRFPDIAQKLDQQARQSGVCLLAIGVGPGFIGDVVPLLMSLACQQIRAVRVKRVTGPGNRVLELREQMGFGLSVDGFNRAGEKGLLGIGGGRESAALVADTLGWRIDDMKEIIEPLVADDRVKTDELVVDKGYVVGLRQRTTALANGQEVIVIEVETSLAPQNAQDEVVVEGTPSLRLVIPNGIQAEAATAALMVNCASAAAFGHHVGLISMRDLSLAPYRTPSNPAAKPDAHPNVQPMRNPGSTSSSSGAISPSSQIR